MKKQNFVLIIIAVAAMFAACNSASKLLKRGDYYRATVEAVQKLRSKPDNANAQQILLQAYSLATQNSLRIIDNSFNSTNPNRYDVVVQEYQKLNNLAEEIFHSPKALELIPQPQQFYGELDNAKNLAAESAYAQGVNFLNQHTVEGARTALQYFIKVQDYVPTYRDINEKLAQAQYEATLRIIVQSPRTNAHYQLSADYFYENLVAEMNRTNQRKMVIFYTPEEAKAEGLSTPHQYIDLDFADFTVGNMRETSRTIDCKRDSVVVGTVTVDGVKHNAYNTVTAKLTVLEREISSGGVLMMNVSDAYTGKNLLKRSLQGSYVWKDSWATYSGDDRALTTQQKALCKRQAQIPPETQVLFVEFTKPIYDQAVMAIKGFYKY